MHSCLPSWGVHWVLMSRFWQYTSVQHVHAMYTFRDYDRAPRTNQSKRVAPNLVFKYCTWINTCTTKAETQRKTWMRGVRVTLSDSKWISVTKLIHVCGRTRAQRYKWRHWLPWVGSDHRENPDWLGTSEKERTSTNLCLVRCQINHVACTTDLCCQTPARVSQCLCSLCGSMDRLELVLMPWADDDWLLSAIDKRSAENLSHGWFGGASALLVAQ